VVQAVVARGLGPVVYGLYGLGWTILRIVTSMTSFGLGQGVVRFGSRHVRGDSARLRDVIVQAFSLALGLGLLAGALLYVTAGSLAVNVFNKPELASVIRWFSPALAFAGGLQVAASATRISKRIQFAAVSQEVFQPFADLVLVVIALGLGWGLAGAVGAAVASFALAMGLAVYFVLRLFPSAFRATERSQPVAGELLGYSSATAVAGMFTSFLILVDRLIVGHFRPAADVGVYQAASTASTLFPVVLTGFSSILAPMIADLHHIRERERLQEIYKVSTKWGIYVSLPVFLLVLFFPTQLMEVGFGERFRAASTLLVILSAGQLVNVSTGSINTVFIMTGHQTRWLVISGVGLALDVGLGVLLTSKYGVTGAALATAIAGGGVWIFSLFDGRRMLGLWPYDHRLFKGGVAVAATSIGLALVKALLNPLDLLMVVAGVVTAVLVFFGTLLILGIDSEDREALAYVRRRLGIGG
jgi:O-antigen/teichoic acid export membrane protein